MDEEKQGVGPPNSGEPPAVPPSSHDQTTSSGHYGTDHEANAYEDAFVYSPPASASDVAPVQPSVIAPEPVAPATSAGSVLPPSAPPTKPPTPTTPSLFDDDGEDDEGMLRMSFLEHLEELRSRIIRILMGLAVAFVFALIFAGK